jgi:hypothetical protein
MLPRFTTAFAKNCTVCGTNLQCLKGKQVLNEVKANEKRTSINFLVAVSWSSNILSGCHFLAYIMRIRKKSLTALQRTPTYHDPIGRPDFVLRRPRRHLQHIIRAHFGQSRKLTVEISRMTDDKSREKKLKTGVNVKNKLVHCIPTPERRFMERVLGSRRRRDQHEADGNTLISRVGSV